MVWFSEVIRSVPFLLTAMLQPAKVLINGAHFSVAKGNTRQSVKQPFPIIPPTIPETSSRTCLEDGADGQPGLQLEMLAKEPTCDFSVWLGHPQGIAASDFLKAGSGFQR